MAMERDSMLVHLLVIALSSVVGFSIAAERRRSVGDSSGCRSMSNSSTSKKAYHTKYREMVHVQNFSCETLRKGVFIAGAIIVVATMILNVYYYIYFIKATTTLASHKANQASSTVSMTGYS